MKRRMIAAITTRGMAIPMPILVAVDRLDDGVVELGSWFERVAVDVAAEVADGEILAIAVELIDIIGGRSDIVVELDAEAVEASDSDTELAAEPLKVLVIAVPLLSLLVEVRSLVSVSPLMIMVDGALVLSVPSVVIAKVIVLGRGPEDSVAAVLVWELSAMSPRRSRSQPD